MLTRRDAVLFHVLPIIRLSGLPAAVRRFMLMLMLMPSPIGQQPASQPPRLSFNGDLNDNNSDSLASNNPFRNMRTASPSFPTTPTSPFDDPMTSSRPLSRNPFLDQPLAPRPVENPAVAGPDKTQSLTAEDIFVRFPSLSVPLRIRSRVPNCLPLLAVWSQEFRQC